MGYIIAGKVWKLGDHVSTDYMAPGFAEDGPWEERKKHILHIHPTFAAKCQPGDVIVAGKNFGCGSSREKAPGNLKALGIACIVAESFGRIFFRNSLAIGLPVVACRGISEMFNEGDRLELNFETSVVRNLTTGKEAKGEILPPDLINVVKKGGVLALLKSERETATG